MSKIIRIPDDLLILVCDARKALLIRNSGPVAQPELQIEDSFESQIDEENAGKVTAPGRRFDGGANATSGGARSAMEITDVAKKQAEDFAERIVEALALRHQTTPLGGLVLVAPPSFLGILRQKLNDELRLLIRQEIGKELAEMPVSEIQKILLNSL